jgi:hypothetical protein
MIANPIAQRKSPPSFATAGFSFGTQQLPAADAPLNAYRILVKVKRRL